MCIILIKYNYCRYCDCEWSCVARGDLTFTLLEYSKRRRQTYLQIWSVRARGMCVPWQPAVSAQSQSQPAQWQLMNANANKQTHHGAYEIKAIFSRIVIISSHFIHFMAFFEMEIINYTYFLMCLMSDEDFNDIHVTFGGLTCACLEMCDWSVL